MALRKPLVINAGQIEQIQAGDTLDAVVTEIDVVSMTNNNANSIVIGAPVYCESAGNVDLAQADASGSIQTDGVLAATTAQWDAVAGTTGGLAAGTIYYLSAVDVGEITATAPTTGGQFVVRIGLALSATELEISISQPIKL